jgi:Bacteriocin-protection, YdeI or OmpD-Associated/Domain of unknown function (DUF1905)
MTAKSKIPQAAVKQSFHTTLLQGGKTITGIEIPAKVVEALDAGKKPPVRITVNGYAYRNTIAVMGGKFMVGFSADHRKASGISGGDEIDVEIELDTQPREVEVPADLQKLLDKDTAVKTYFESLSYSKKQWLVLPIKDAKTEETRQRRIEKAIEALKAGKL